MPALHVSFHSALAGDVLSLSILTDGAHCYGSRVVLLCTHPLLLDHPVYQEAEVSWRRNGTAFSAVGLGRTNPSNKATSLNFSITGNVVGDYACFLVNPDAPNGTDESNNVTVRPVGESSFLLMTLYI